MLDKLVERKKREAVPPRDGYDPGMEGAIVVPDSILLSHLGSLGGAVRWEKKRVN